MAKRTFFGFLGLVLLCSCSTKEIEYVDKIVEVNVPVYVVPKIAIPQKPILPVKSINEKSNVQDIVEAYYNSLKMQIEYTDRLEKILKQFQ